MGGVPRGEASIIERAIRLTNIELRAAGLQRRRVGSTEPEDDEFVLRWWTDLQFFIVALSRLRRSAEIAASAPSAEKQVRLALASFDEVVPGLREMRNIGEHVDEYALDSSRRRVKSIDSHQLEVGAWNGQTFQWLGHSLNVDEALEAGVALFTAVQSLRPTIAT